MFQDSGAYRAKVILVFHFPAKVLTRIIFINSDSGIRNVFKLLAQNK